jgi:hypothetical protein
LIDPVKTKLAIPVIGGVHNAMSDKILHDVATVAAATNYDTIPSSLMALFISGFWSFGSRTSVHGIVGAAGQKFILVGWTDSPRRLIMINDDNDKIVESTSTLPSAYCCCYCG